MKQEIGTTELTWVGQSDGSGTDPKQIGWRRRPAEARSGHRCYRQHDWIGQSVVFRHSRAAEPPATPIGSGQVRTFR